jgi:hypothetical protein
MAALLYKKPNMGMATSSFLPTKTKRGQYSSCDLQSTNRAFGWTLLGGGLFESKNPCQKVPKGPIDFEPSKIQHGIRWGTTKRLQ